MRTNTRLQSLRARFVPAAVAAILMALAITVPVALAGNGGIGPGGDGGGSGGGSGGGDCIHRKHAKLSHGLAVPPCKAPHRVKDVISAANRIAKGKSYCYGGGHQSYKSSCYDCSGSVSYALHGGRLVHSPLDSTGFMHWGKRHRGRWITVLANSGHAFMKVAGLRFDTSMTAGAGPGWSDQMRSKAGYRVRHWRHL